MMRFTINHQKWKIMVTRPDSLHLRRMDNSFALASCDNKTRTIYLSTDIKEYDLRDVIIHEIVHAILFSYDINITASDNE
jgi:hypothetical protein